jgi:Oxidoreductase family, NAD-binding Rossmann fold
MSRLSLLTVLLAMTLATPLNAADPPELKVGIIGLDTSHAVAFTKELNARDAKEDVARCRVVAAYPQGSPDILSSTERVPQYIEAVKKEGVEIVDSIDELLKRVDCVLLETNDGRPHLEQALPVFKAGKPCFIDKPVAGSLADAIAIYAAAKKYNCPVFCSSSLRYSKAAQELRAGGKGKILGCDTYSPCSLEPTHPDLYWYGVHGCEALYTVMGTGCESVTRVSTADFDSAIGVWGGGRIGTFRGIRTKEGSGYGGTAYTQAGIFQIGGYEGYRPLVVEIVKFFRSKQPPVAGDETVELYAFMEAADESKRRGGAPAKIQEVMRKAQGDAEKRLAALGVK